MSNIISSIKNFRDRLRANITIKSKNFIFFLALFLVVFLAIYIRLSPALLGNTLIKAFDPWIQYYNADYLSTHSLYDYFQWHDSKSWYPGGFDRYNLRPGLTFTVVIIYQIFNSLGIPVSLYDVCFYFPAILGGLTVFATYLLGKEVLNRQMGLFAAFFMAFTPAYMQRTVAGFFDNETIGVFSTVMTLYFFVKTIRTGKITHSILGGVFLGYLSLSWGGYYFIYYLLPILCFILILTKKYNTNVLIAYAGTEGTGLLLFSLYINFRFGSFFSDIALGGTFLFTIILVIYHLIYTRKEKYPKFYSRLINLVKWGLIPIIIVIAVIIWIDPGIIPFGFGGRLQSVLSPLLRDTMHLTASVAEHAPSAWSVFYYNTLIPLTLVPLGLFFLFRRSNPADILMIIFLLLLFYFTGSMIRIILIFAPAACLVGAYGLVSILKIFGSFYGERRVSISRKRKKQLKQMMGKSEVAAIYFIVGIMCLAQVWHASNFAAVQLSSSQIAPGGYHDWEEALTWMKTNLPGSTVVVSWWDYGYWITPIGNMTSVNDNATINSTRIGLTGMAMMQTNEIYSAKIFRLLKADYVLVYFGYLFDPLGGDEGKWPWMLRICNDHYEKYKSWGLEEDNWATNSVFVESEYYNSTSGRPTKKWFDAQIVKLMFYGISTEPYSGDIQTFDQYYRRAINAQLDDDGDTWATNIPDGGYYDFKVFQPPPKGGYFSGNAFVKIYKMDYTPLDSSFSIKNPEVFDSGYATFKIKNTGSKNLTITSVKINGQSFDYHLGKGIESNIVATEDDDLVWVDIKSGGTTFKKNDVVNITVEARSKALEGDYDFSNSTEKFFVKEALPSEIKINEANSKVVQINKNQADLYLEVENIGDSVVIIDDFYADSENDTFSEKEYLSGSPILNPGEKANVHIINTDISFYPIRTVHKIGVITPGGTKDEILMTSNYENYKIELQGTSRIISPEASIITDSSLRTHIPIELDKTYAYSYDNGTTMLNIKVKNTGDIIFALDSVYLTQTDEWTEVDFNPKQGTIYPNGEKTIKVIASDYFDVNVNDEIGIVVTALFNGSSKGSDVGFVQSVNSSADIQIIKNVLGTQASYIVANETGQLLIKNTGIAPIKLDTLYINETTQISIENDTKFIHGDIDLDFQECALISFNISDLKINASNTLNLMVKTNTSAVAYASFSAYVDSERYNIEIDDSDTYADRSENKLVIKIVNKGLLNVTVDSVYINNTYIPLTNFTVIDGTNFTIIDEVLFELKNSGGYITISISLTAIEEFLELSIGSIIAKDKLEILARTEEGAEYIHEISVGS